MLRVMGKAVLMKKTPVACRRKAERIDISLPVKLLVEGTNEPYEFETVNLSEGGVYIPTDQPLAVETRVTLTFPLSAIDSNVEATGTVVRSNSGRTESGEVAGMAIEFLEYGKLGWSLLRRFLVLHRQPKEIEGSKSGV